MQARAGRRLGGVTGAVLQCTAKVLRASRSIEDRTASDPKVAKRKLRWRRWLALALLRAKLDEKPCHWHNLDEIPFPLP